MNIWGWQIDELKTYKGFVITSTNLPVISATLDFLLVQNLWFLIGTNRFLNLQYRHFHIYRRIESCNFQQTEVHQ